MKTREPKDKHCVLWCTNIYMWHLTPRQLQDLFTPSTAIHNNSKGHQGTIHILEAIRRFYWWPKLCHDIIKHINKCDICAKNLWVQPEPLWLISTYMNGITAISPPFYIKHLHQSLELNNYLCTDEFNTNLTKLQCQHFTHSTYKPFEWWHHLPQLLSRHYWSQTWLMSPQDKNESGDILPHYKSKKRNFLNKWSTDLITPITYPMYIPTMSLNTKLYY